MKIIGLTGPSGSGKSYCCQALATNGIPTINADEVYHELIATDTPCVRELVAAFGCGILNENGGINRRALAAIVFAEDKEKKLLQLNAIAHKYVHDVTCSRIVEYEAQGIRAVTVDAPLLFEANFDSFCDFCIAVLAPIEMRLCRIMARDSIPEEQARARLAAQKSDDFYRTRADYVIVNDSTCERLESSVTEILRKESLLS